MAEKKNKILRNKDKGIVLILNKEPFLHNELTEKLREDYSCYQQKLTNPMI